MKDNTYHKFSEKYNLKYSKKSFYRWTKPSKLVTDSIKFLPPKSKVLDLGCWEWRNSFFLAEKWFDVTAVDLSEVWINKLKDFANQNNLNIKTQVSDMWKFLDECEEFDVIFCMNSLQFVGKKNIFSMIDKVKSKTKNWWFNIIASLIIESEAQKQSILSKGKYYFDEWELKNIYKDWEIRFYEEKLSDWETHGLPKHRHYNVSLIAKNK